ncbi:phosphoribosylaminoimidazole carboxylase, ATPase subunit [Alicyclobacillus hesperidum URH17-3-68]|uniref:5-(carboxyamino)imidazole ribonucleotide synthase n=1 Tax=Alicyclobacillus hesperidum TaxID=89784 RepID=UPI000281AD74|nr:5-(carboxyamino)imidazole ribonucleotide synthase [Alicyclobacillus hesperidum]EJY56290.1 phosphoribosylaminoimidazole carboxylase, ATPase subunit [Alicyclobacillus hesperidum URH17-3-68]
MPRNEYSPAASILPPAVIGILGGGQLGRMMALDGRRMGYRFQVLDPTPDCPAAQVSDGQVVAKYDDVEAAKLLSHRCDVITYEFENVDADVAAALEHSAHVPQGSRLLATTQHRVREKSTLAKAGLPVTPFVPIANLEDIQSAFAQLGERLVVKTCRGGYDGKGQWMVREPSDADRFLPQWQSIIEAHTRSGADDEPLIAEQYIPFVGECSVIVARSPRGETAAFPVAENVHMNHILHMSIVPARFPEEVLVKARSIACDVARKLDVVGLIAVEFFVAEGGQLYINELAPRPHNSGHYTMDACSTSQFEQHVRAICNLPLGDVSLLTPVVMVNVLGQDVDPLLRAMPSLPGQVKVHLYGKAEVKRDRKMGHINILASDVEQALQVKRDLGIWQVDTQGEG